MGGSVLHQWSIFNPISEPTATTVFAVTYSMYVYFKYSFSFSFPPPPLRYWSSFHHACLTFIVILFSHFMQLQNGFGGRGVEVPWLSSACWLLLTLPPLSALPPGVGVSGYGVGEDYLPERLCRHGHPSSHGTLVDFGRRLHRSLLHRVWPRQQPSRLHYRQLNDGELCQWGLWQFYVAYCFPSHRTCVQCFTWSKYCLHSDLWLPDAAWNCCKVLSKD